MSEKKPVIVNGKKCNSCNFNEFRIGTRSYTVKCKKCGKEQAK
jgi:translation initiation factor 2 beta subunit (eIF-2beta)/eIF-5